MKFLIDIVVAGKKCNAIPVVNNNIFLLGSFVSISSNKIVLVYSDKLNFVTS